MPARSFVPLNHLYKALLVSLLLVPLYSARGANHDWNYEETHSDVREFVSGGRLHLHMSVGDLHVKRGDSNRIRLSYTVKSRRERNVKDTRVDFEVRGNDASIEFHAPSSSNTQFDVELEVPANTNLDLHNKVGDITVDNVDGDKDLELGVGDIRVARGNSPYRLVRASTGVGDVSGEGYGEITGWLGKTLKYHGDGQYELRAHVGVGDINLEGK
jgi:hypothetical protein